MSLSSLHSLSLLHFITSLLFLFYVLSFSVLSLLFFSLPSPLTSLPSYPFSLSIHPPLSSLPLLSSTFSFLPSLTFFSLLAPPHSFLSFQLSLSPILSVLSYLSLLYIFLLSLLFSPFSTSLPFSSLFFPLILSLSTPFCLSHLHFLSSLLSHLLSFLPSLTSPFSIPSPLHSLSTQSFSLHFLLCLIFIFILFPLPFFPL